MMLVWALKNWQTIILGVAFAALAGFVANFYFSFKSLETENTTLKSNVTLLENAVADQKLATDAALNAANKFDDKLKEFERDLQSLSEENQAFARRIGDIRRELAAADLGNLVRRNPEEAGRVAGGVFNELGRLYQCATAGSKNCTDRGSDTTGQGDSPATR